MYHFRYTDPTQPLCAYTHDNIYCVEQKYRPPKNGLCFFDTLPNEIIEHIFSYMDRIGNYFNCRGVCKRFDCFRQKHINRLCLYDIRISNNCIGTCREEIIKASSKRGQLNGNYAGMPWLGNPMCEYDRTVKSQLDNIKFYNDRVLCLLKLIKI